MHAETFRRLGEHTLLLVENVFHPNDLHLDVIMRDLMRRIRTVMAWNVQGTLGGNRVR